MEDHLDLPLPQTSPKLLHFPRVSLTAGHKLSCLMTQTRQGRAAVMPPLYAEWVLRLPSKLTSPWQRGLGAGAPKMHCCHTRAPEKRLFHFIAPPNHLGSRTPHWHRARYFWTP